MGNTKKVILSLLTTILLVSCNTPNNSESSSLINDSSNQNSSSTSEENKDYIGSIIDFRKNILANGTKQFESYTLKGSYVKSYEQGKKVVVKDVDNQAFLTLNVTDLNTDIAEGDVCDIVFHSNDIEINNFGDIEVNNPQVSKSGETLTESVEAEVVDNDFFENVNNSLILFNQLKKEGPKYIRIEEFKIINDNTLDNGTYQINYRYDETNTALVEALEDNYQMEVNLRGFIYFSPTANKIELLVVDANDVKLSITERPFELNILGNDRKIRGSYANNYEEVEIGSTKFAFSRFSKMYSDYFTLNPFPSEFFIDHSSDNGFVSNIDPINAISKISITFSQPSISDFKLSYGKTRELAQSRSIEGAIEETKVEIKTSEVNYFRIEAGNTPLHISEINIFYRNSNEIVEEGYFGVGKLNTRLNPVEIDLDNLQEGQEVEVPYGVSKNSSGSYYVNTRKTITYYSFDYVQVNPHLIEISTVVEPKMVANYFNVFQKFPANYGLKGNTNQVVQLFGDMARQVSVYTRTDGYALSVPWREHSNGVPLYYEFDIAHDENYSIKSRGEGRVVSWVNGLEAEGYNYAPVSLYTDDHYKSWQEYYNNGLFSPKYNGEWKATPYVFSPATTITIG